MRKIISVFITYFCINFSAFSQESYKLDKDDFDFSEFPTVTFKLWSRGISEIDSSKINIKEKDNEIPLYKYKLLEDTVKNETGNKIIFILIENHYLPKGINERTFFKDILTNSLKGKIKLGDKVYIGTFDWYRNNKYLFLLNEKPLDDENQIFTLINNISSPPNLNNEQNGADIYFALDETLKFLANIKDSLPKNILLLSDDFPNIAGQKTVNEIRNESLKSDIPIYAIGYNIGADRYSLITKNEICIQSNGSYFSSLQNDKLECINKLKEFIENMNSNSSGKTYLISFISKQNKNGQKIPISVELNENKTIGIIARYPFNIFNWIGSNILLSIILLLIIITIFIFVYRIIKKRRLLKTQKQLEQHIKEQKIKEAENQIQQLQHQHVSQQISNEQKFIEHKIQIEEDAKLEKLKQLMKAKSLIPRIIFDNNGQKGQFYIDTPKFTIGRDEKSNSFSISAPSISRNHAVILFNENGRFLLNDLNSSNGIIVNDKRESTVVLKHGDIIKLGDVILKVNL